MRPACAYSADRMCVAKNGDTDPDGRSGAPAVNVLERNVPIVPGRSYVSPLDEHETESDSARSVTNCIRHRELDLRCGAAFAYPLAPVNGLFFRRLRLSSCDRMAGRSF
jgi:hypothetical protein